MFLVWGFSFRAALLRACIPTLNSEPVQTVGLNPEGAGLKV